MPVEELIVKPGGNPYPETLRPSSCAESIEKLASLPTRRLLDPESGVAVVGLEPETKIRKVAVPD
jgi:hypothetical protein